MPITRFSAASGASDAAEATLSTARRVLQTEADALVTLSRALPADFLSVVSLILEAKGRVIFSGVGKSGHIARKIAATFSSTGTPSYFVHAGEASHGDLGTITEADICIALSNSGETPELSDLIAHTRRFSIPLVAITSRGDSTLSSAADYLLLLPPAPEACIIGMAPTTSTTLALALGDALAISLMERRGFLPEHFRTFHPGGKLGARLARVSQIMRGPEFLPLVAPDQPMTETILVMTEKGVGVAGLVEDGRLTGIITDGDLRRHMDGLMTMTAKDVATRNPLTADPTMLAAEAVAAMNARKVHMMFVVDEGKRPLGVLHIHDCLRAGVA
ncbi:KpsF/GutQ family sugar-phosphate isomerase [Roseicyclus persicicus]|uniref:KpsF/GutQ family sugar-phosphate isomerase n=1 Tax=Roseicyclus persicicus TaxID=2650661 RepID=A0A7X6H1Z4_9RHOB|nr:KpsF/GutQ family sugar-phosphate isomerase [Roseibacterium persicicum]NKX45341.1 KpsF/GutQ family sugar-phosphate isomerase [Roseibacterium persicicum]